MRFNGFNRQWICFWFHLWKQGRWLLYWEKITKKIRKIRYVCVRKQMFLKWNLFGEFFLSILMNDRFSEKEKWNIVIYKLFNATVYQKNINFRKLSGKYHKRCTIYLIVFGGTRVYGYGISWYFAMKSMRLLLHSSVTKCNMISQWKIS